MSGKELVQWCKIDNYTNTALVKLTDKQLLVITFIWCKLSYSLIVSKCNVYFFFAFIQKDVIYMCYFCMWAIFLEAEMRTENIINQYSWHVFFSFLKPLTKIFPHSPVKSKQWCYVEEVNKRSHNKAVKRVFPLQYSQSLPGCAAQ